MSKKKPKAVEHGVATAAVAWQRYVVLALAVLVPLVFSRNALEPYTTAKASVLAVGAVALVALQLTRVVATGRMSLPWGWLGVTVAALTAAFVVAATVGGWRGSSVLGAPSRSSGLITYLAATVVFATVARRFDTRRVVHLAWALIATAATVSAVALLQRGAPGLLPFQVVRELVGVNGTLSNSNFASGFIGICVPLAAWGLLQARDAQRRVLFGAAVVLCLGGIWAADSLQGWIAGLAGTVVVVASTVPQLPRRLRPKAAVGVAVVSVLGLVVGLAGLAGVGPLRALGQQSAFTIRSWYWEAAVDMWRDSPVLGVGLDQYANYYRAYRPLEATLAFPVNLSADAAHSVPLMMLASGGILLALAYVGFIAFTGLKGIQAFRGRPQQQQLVGGFAGAWVAYHVQSAVSIDVVPLVLAHFTVAGAVVALSGAVDFKAVALPWASASSRRANRGRLAWAGAALGALLLVGAVTVSLRTFGADVAAGTGSRLLAENRPQEAIAALQSAVNTAPARSRYHVLLGRAQYGADQLRNARVTFDQAAATEPRDFEAVLWQARARALVGDVDAARASYETALQLEPSHPQLKVEVARFEASEGRTEVAMRLLDAALSVDPNNADASELRQTLDAGGTETS